MNSYVIAGLVVTTAIAFVVAPLLRKGRGGTGPRSSAAPAPRESREAPRPSALEEIELDFAVGKLEKAEYEALRARYTTDLAAEPTSAHAEPDGRRADRVISVTTESANERAEALIRAQRPSGAACAVCGPRPEPDARFCSTCGCSLRVCPACGAELGEHGGRYCTSCGSALAG